MKSNDVVLKTTKTIIFGTVLLTGVQQLIYGILCLSISALTWSYQFLLGNLLMDVAVVLNFYLMSCGIVKAQEEPDEVLSKKMVRSSHTMRTFMMLVFLIIGVVVPIFDWVACLFPIAYPTIIFLFVKKKNGEEDS